MQIMAKANTQKEKQLGWKMRISQEWVASYDFVFILERAF